jgi:hypothetical protein
MKKEGRKMEATTVRPRVSKASAGHLKAGGKLTNDVSIRDARAIWRASTSANPDGELTYRQLEEKYGLLEANGMTAFRIVRRYRRYLELRSAGQAHAAAKAGFVLE